MNAQAEVRCRNSLSELERVSQVTTAFGERHQLPKQLVFEINLVLEEVLLSGILKAIHDFPHQVDPQSSNRPLFDRLLEVWRRHL